MPDSPDRTADVERSAFAGSADSPLAVKQKHLAPEVEVQAMSVNTIAANAATNVMGFAKKGFSLLSHRGGDDPEEDDDADCYKERAKKKNKVGPITFEPRNIYHPKKRDQSYIVAEGDMNIKFETSGQKVKHRNFKYISLQKDEDAKEGYALKEVFSFNYMLNTQKDKSVFNYTEPCYPR